MCSLVVLPLGSAAEPELAASQCSLSGPQWFAARAEAVWPDSAVGSAAEPGGEAPSLSSFLPVQTGGA